jgi:hypothetical protein
MHLERDLGFLAPEEFAKRREEIRSYVNLKLAANGLPTVPSAGGADLVRLASGLLANFGERSRLLADYRCPADARIERFLADYFGDVVGDAPLRLPGRTVILDRHGIARELSIPGDGREFRSPLLQSYRVVNGVLHNPKHDRRTTSGTFHICAGGLPVPADKREVPRQTFAALFRRAFQAPDELTILPFTAHQQPPGRAYVSLLLRPLVCPEVPLVSGSCRELTMETRFFAPGSLVSNLDFVESIFGNAGDPYLPENDAGLDVEHWSGHTGCVILAPHLTGVTKREVGLPHVSEATARQRHEGMCWSDENELYNDGEPFKLTCRATPPRQSPGSATAEGVPRQEGVVVTLISDNYFGYCKKEVKTQISYAANLTGNVEEEHAGGAMVFQSWSLGETYQARSEHYNGRTFDDVVRDYGGVMDVKPQGYAVDRTYRKLVYIPEHARADLREQQITWERGGQQHAIRMLPGHVYMAPSGFKIRMEKHPAAPSWRLIGTAGEGTICHKPCTVSGGGKSEISKSLVDYMEYGSVFVSNFRLDFDLIDEIFHRDYTDRWTPEMRARQSYETYPSRPILSPMRSLGSVIKLLTPSEDYNEEYNAWLRSLPPHIYPLVFIIKRFHQPDWGDDWQKYFGVDIVNGNPGHELKLMNRPIVGSYLRVGFAPDGNWRTFKLRQDFAAAAKVQTEDDISASVVIPRRCLANLPGSTLIRRGSDPALVPEKRFPRELPPPQSYKFLQNCEYRLFQRPDDAIHRGLDRQAEADLARRDVNFISNFEPLTRSVVLDMIEKVVEFEGYTPPMQELLKSVEQGRAGYIVCSDNPRRIGNVPSKNPRYLQDRPDLVRPMDRYVAEMGARLFRAVPADQPVYLPVTAVLAGRRLNPPDPVKGFRSLAVYSPIHYQELPELFMDFIASLTGRSPSTTGAGSEGAMTKGPFNMLRPAADLNAALVSHLLTGLAGFTSAAGYIGPEFRADHDVSLLIPEVWCRILPEERDPDRLIAEGSLEPVPDVTARGESVPCHRLGYRITERFITRYFGRVFDNPDRVFDERILRPELQDPVSFVDGVKYIREAHQRIAQQYFDDGTVEELCPPLRVLVSIMAHGTHEGRDERHPEVRALFTLESMLGSDWYARRLRAKQDRDMAHWQRSIAYLESLRRSAGSGRIDAAELAFKLDQARARLAEVSTDAYRDSLHGTLGVQP